MVQLTVTRSWKIRNIKQWNSSNLRCSTDLWTFRTSWGVNGLESSFLLLPIHRTDFNLHRVVERVTRLGYLVCSTCEGMKWQGQWKKRSQFCREGRECKLSPSRAEFRYSLPYWCTIRSGVVKMKLKPELYFKYNGKLIDVEGVKVLL